MTVKSKLSKAVLALILAGAGSVPIVNQFLDEREGNKLTAYKDGNGVWTICRGTTEGVYQGMKLTNAECDERNVAALQVASAALDRLAPGIEMSEPERAGIISFCTYNLGPTRCASTTFLKLLKSGDRPGACKQILRWIHDGDKDCTVDKSCRGQVDRRAQEYELCMLN